MPGKRSSNIIQVNLRLTKGLHKRLAAEADKVVGRSLNAEMVDRLERSFKREKADAILDRAQRHLAEARRNLDAAESAATGIAPKLRAEPQGRANRG